MNEKMYKDTISKIKASDQFKAELKEKWPEKAYKSRQVRKAGYLITAAACLALAFVATGIYAVISSAGTKEIQGNAGNGFGKITVNLSLDSGEQTADSSITLPANALNGISGMVDIPIPSDGCNAFTYSNDNGAETVDGDLCLDITVNGPGVEKVIFESKNYEMSYEDSRNWLAEDGTPIWSEFTVLIPESKIAVEPLSKDSIISALKRILSSVDDESIDLSKTILEQIYVEKLCEELANGGTAESFYERMKDVQIDFSQYEISYYIYDNANNNKGLTPLPAGQREVAVTIGNPEHRYIPKVWSKKIETRNGETVVWGMDDQAFKKNLGLPRQEADYSVFADEITITVVDSGGNMRSQTWKISCGENGNIVITEVSAGISA